MEEYYNEINYNEYEIKYFSAIPISDGEIKYISDFLKKNKIESSLEIKEDEVTRVFIKKINGVKDNSICISRLKDEWFLIYVNLSELYYICDQMDGLIDLIKDRKDNKI